MIINNSLCTVQCTRSCTYHRCSVLFLVEKRSKRGNEWERQTVVPLLLLSLLLLILQQCYQHQSLIEHCNSENRENRRPEKRPKHTNRPTLTTGHMTNYDQLPLNWKSIRLLLCRHLCGICLQHMSAPATGGAHTRDHHLPVSWSVDRSIFADHCSERENGCFFPPKLSLSRAESKAPHRSSNSRQFFGPSFSMWLSAAAAAATNL